MKIKILVCIFFIYTLSGCVILFFGAGTLGGFDIRTFPTSKTKLVVAIDNLYKDYPEYKIPEKWKSFDDWHKRGYDFLDSRIFYFKATPEEMYYVTFIGDSTVQANPNRIKISIRAVNNGVTGWTLEEKFKRKDRERVEQRFNKEIISKLEQYTGTKATREK